MAQPTDGAGDAVYDADAMTTPPLNRISHDASSSARSRLKSDVNGWATSSARGDVDTLPGDLNALGTHAQACRGASGKWFELRCMVESVVNFVAPRIVTTAIAVVLVLGVISLIA